MNNSTKALHSLKRASNYSKLAMRDFGPKSFKKGQGALLKVIYKFGEEGKINKKTAEKILGWCGKNLRHVAKKAQRNGYISIEDPEFAFAMSLTDKGTEVIKKRMDAEDRAADAILEQLSDEEIASLISITEKISDTCEGLGVDYSRIEKKQRRHHGARRGEKCCCKHHGKEGGQGKKHCCKHEHENNSSKYVFVFK